jgi:hypothetical protein
LLDDDKDGADFLEELVGGVHTVHWRGLYLYKVIATTTVA